MSETEDQPLEPIDPPDNTGGGTTTVLNPEPIPLDAEAIDPPDNTGGGTAQ